LRIEEKTNNQASVRKDRVAVNTKFSSVLTSRPKDSTLNELMNLNRSSENIENNGDNFYREVLFII
jgi:hypothetical protein